MRDTRVSTIVLQTISLASLLLGASCSDSTTVVESNDASCVVSPGGDEPASSDEAAVDASPDAAGEEMSGPFHLSEATISSIHHALATKAISCVALTQLYYKRIKAYSGHCVEYDKDGDGTGPDYDFTMPSGKGIYLGVVKTVPNAGKVNSIQTVNLRPANYTAMGFAPPHDPGPRSETDLVDADPNLPDALEVAATLDAEYATSGQLRPLHCIPMVIKDQMETIDMRTTDGSLTEFANDRPPNDGTLVAKLRKAGAIVLAKSAMDEYAGGTHRSSYAGQMCNPWATDRNAGSSSTGSATSVSVNLSVCGIAEEMAQA